MKYLATWKQFRSATRKTSESLIVNSTLRMYSKNDEYKINDFKIDTYRIMKIGLPPSWVRTNILSNSFCTVK